MQSAADKQALEELRIQERMVSDRLKSQKKMEEEERRRIEEERKKEVQRTKKIQDKDT